MSLRHLAVTSAAILSLSFCGLAAHAGTNAPNSAIGAKGQGAGWTVPELIFVHGGGGGGHAGAGTASFGSSSHGGSGSRGASGWGGGHHGHPGHHGHRRAFSSDVWYDDDYYDYPDYGDEVREYRYRRHHRRHQRVR